MKNNLLILSLIFVLLLSGESFSATVDTLTVSIPSIYASPGDTIEIPINVDIPLSKKIISGELTLELPSFQYSFISVSLDSSILNGKGWSISKNYKDDTLRFAAAGATDIYGKGNLFKVKVKIIYPLPAEFPISLVDYTFNTGVTPVNVLSGSVFSFVVGDVNLDAKISVTDAAYLNEALRTHSSFYGIRALSADIDGDKNITRVDLALLLGYLDGSIDNLPVDTTQTNLTPSGSLTVSNYSAHSGDTISVIINSSNFQNVYSFGFDIFVQKDKLIPLEAKLLNDVDTTFASVLPTKYGYSILYSGAQRVIGSEGIFLIKFKIPETDYYSTEILTVRNALFNNQNFSNIVLSSTISVLPKIKQITKGDVNFDNVVDVKDVQLLLDYVDGRVTFSAEQKVAGEVTGDTITVLDAATVYRFTLGKIAALPYHFPDSTFAKLTLSIPTVCTTSDSSVSIAITANKVSNIYSISARLNLIGTVALGKPTFYSLNDKFFYYGNSTGFHLLASEPLSNTDNNLVKLAFLGMSSTNVSDSVQLASLDINGVNLIDETVKIYLTFVKNAIYQNAVLSEPYPNPVSSELGGVWFDFAEPEADGCKVNIYSTSGEKIACQQESFGTKTSKNFLKLPQLSSGAYIIEIIGEKFRLYKKIILIK